MFHGSFASQGNMDRWLKESGPGRLKVNVVFLKGGHFPFFKYSFIWFTAFMMLLPFVFYYFKLTKL